jgi:hypothetical protein
MMAMPAPSLALTTPTHEKFAARRKTPSSAWRPGQSDNPGGRPKMAAEIRDHARDHGPRAIARLVALMDSENESVAVRAAEALLDRGYGRPMQGVEFSGQAERPAHRLIEITFVEPRKRDADRSLPQRPPVIGLPRPK